MRFRETPIAGAKEVLLEPYDDERGFFARTWCLDEFVEHRLPSRVVQCSISDNRVRGTVRGMHFQWPPSSEGKLVRCERGSVHDVIIDLRPESATFLLHFGVTLLASHGNGIFVPPGCAHGFQTLEDDTRIGYMMTDSYAPELSSGVRWDDPAFRIVWPVQVTVISSRDKQFALFDRRTHELDYARALRGSM